MSAEKTNSTVESRVSICATGLAQQFLTGMGTVKDKIVLLLNV